MRFSRESFDEVAFPPISQAGVAKLPPEMIEEILSMHLRSFDEDPVYQWLDSASCLACNACASSSASRRYGCRA